MALSSGSRLGPYEVLSPIGAGGMGEVYRATDTRLNRIVAIKVLPPHFADDPDMRQRFEREAQTIAGLNHPNICTLHDVGEAHVVEPGRAESPGAPAASKVSYLVMEFVEGETLADRLSRGPLSIDETLRIGGEIIDALDRAHRQGVVHRDLKPANVMLATTGATRQRSSPTPSGASQTLTVTAGEKPASGATRPPRSGAAPAGRSTTALTKLLDFGLAKWTTTGGQPSLAAQSTRLDVTAQGTIVGTLQYMAPEQVEGREADARTDIFAFGAVVYEMLTGRKAFEGKSQASLIGAIMKAEPRPIAHSQPLTPAALEHVVARCLAKDPDERWQDAHGVRTRLEWIARSRTGETTAVVAPRRRWMDVAIGATALVALAAVSVPAYLQWRGAPPPEPVQYRHTITGLSAGDTALSPDGRTIAFVAKPDAQAPASLYVRPIGGVASVKLAGTDNATQPFWSPDSQTIAFVVSGRLKKVPASGGALGDLGEVADFSGGAWSRADGGTIVFGSGKGLQRISAEGGPVVPLGGIAEGEAGQLWPAFLPDGRHFVFLSASSDAAKRAVQLGSLDSAERRKLIDVDSNAIYASPGHLLFRRQGTVFAQPFDAGDLVTTGDPIQVVGQVGGEGGRGYFSVSQTGALIYFQSGTGAAASGRGRAIGGAQFGWIEPKTLQRTHALDAGTYGDMDLSPDGTRIAITRQEAGAPNADIWVVDWARAVWHKVTDDPADAVDPVWAPDNLRVAFTTWRKGNADIYVKNANGVGEDTPLLESEQNESIEDWSSDGKFIAFKYGKDQFQDIYAAPIEGGKAGKPFPVVQGPFQKDEPQFSKDGKWLAYTSDENEAGRFQVYVISFPGGELKQQISTDAGGQPRWKWDGTEVYYRSPNNQYLKVTLKLGARIEPSAPALLTPAPVGGASANDAARHQWAVTSTGRFLMRVPAGAATGAAGGSAIIAPIFQPAGQAGAAAPSRGPVTSGLTAILHWPSALVTR